ncbi:AMP-binding protein [Aurantimonas endophytica]|uniref:Propionyl-CoA synthetase n=1 Tax=Aurantimonas endophytica TaxID=1522175 RepID=A0A7W6MPC6_9HYPH|nr:AMP-binding protein [Aurantimonas endophytica]MBB4002732.1 propionyl-CoA synthetase [Aurantimonas endophytica]MCO6403610.1 AMP-binding protein [Aurantimonas endophytica]
MTSRYHETYATWRRDPEGFWLAAAEDITWTRKPTRAFDPAAGVYGHWFPDGECNTCFNALDRHVEAGRGDAIAVIHDSAITGRQRHISYRDLLREVQALAASLADLGVGKGDRVLIYMPMVPEAIVSMLACARVGAIHSVVFGGFAAPELATRIDDATPKVILSASCGLEPTRKVEYKPLLDRAIDLAAHKVSATIILQRLELECSMVSGRDHDWAALRAAGLAAIDAGRDVPCVPVKATDPLYVLYTSGTTGKPKGVVRDNGGYMIALSWSMRAIFDTDEGETFFCASDVGWVVGHSYIVYGPLLRGATTILYEGKPVGTPDAGAFWRVAAEHGAKALITAPTAIRGMRKEDPEGQLPARYDLSKFEALFLAGERADPETLIWAEEALGCPVIDHWWQTESGWPIAANPKGLGLLPVKRGSPGVAMPGFDIRILDAFGQAVEANEMGAIALKLPLPPGALPSLWNADDRFRESYLEAYPGYYSTSDAGFVDEEGYVYVMGRTDDVINVAGHRLSTGEMEEAVAGHPAVAECAVIGMRDELKGELPCGFVVLKNASRQDRSEIERELVALVRDRIGPVAAFKRVIVVDRLPKTRSGKILRRTMKAIVDRDEFDMPATIEDPAAIDDVKRAVEG